MSVWRPSFSQFTLPFRPPVVWGLSLERFGKGIDNAHVDVYLGSLLRERLRDTVRKLLLEDLRVPVSGRGSHEQLVGVRELEAFRDSYLAMFEATWERSRVASSPDLPALLQVAQLKSLLQMVADENLNLQQELKTGGQRNGAQGSGPSLDARENLVTLTRGGQAINRRVLRLLFRQLRQLESGPLRRLRTGVAGDGWPIPEVALFNPVLTVPELGEMRGLAEDYPVVLLADNRDAAWLFQTNQCISKVFQYYLPAWSQMPSDAADGSGSYAEPQERLDQGQLRGFLGTEVLLRRFVPQDEYRSGRCSWLDEPENLRLFLDARDAPSGVASECPAFPHCGYWDDPRWGEFRRAVIAELNHCLEMHGLTRPVNLLYRLASFRTPSGRRLPLPLMRDYLDGRIPRRQLLKQLVRMRIGLDHTTATRVLDGVVDDAKLTPGEQSPYISRFLVDFLSLRRDIKLAYKAYETMDGIRLIEEPEEVQLSRSNATLIEFDYRDEPGPAVRRIIGHTVIKADVRGSTRITEQLRDRGLNPASHFSRNFFDPVNKLLTEFGAEKLFVEGDAVILVIFEYEGEGAGLCVARACGLARKILQVVALQNVQNRKHRLPELELGLGISFSRGEPNFLYDEGRRIMISGAINRADRLSACASGLRASGFAPEHEAFRVTVVGGGPSAEGATDDRDLLNYNVNGVKLEQDAFFKLQRELSLRQVRLPDDEVADTLFFTGSYPDLIGRVHWLVLRYGPVRFWDGHRLGQIDPRRRHFFEVIVDEELTARVRRLVREGAP